MSKKKRETADEQAPAVVMTAEERHQRIAEGAYLRAAARDFAGGDPMQDWLDAEKEVDRQ